MDMTIKELDPVMVDRFITQDTDIFGRIVRKETEFHKTVDLLINVRTVAVDSNHIIIEFPNNSVLAVNIPGFHYLKIEVM